MRVACCSAKNQLLLSPENEITSSPKITKNTEVLVNGFNQMLSEPLLQETTLSRIFGIIDHLEIIDFPRQQKNKRF